MDANEKAFNDTDAPLDTNEAESADDMLETTELAGEESQAEATDSACSGQGMLEAAPVRNTIMDVLFPCTPPMPRNARLIRGLGFSTGDHVSAPEPVVQQPADKPDRATTREAERAMRNRSLRAAAGLE